MRDELQPSWCRRITWPLRVSCLALCLTGVSHGAQEREPDLQTVLHRAGDYVRTYQERLSEIVAEELYVQRTEADRSTGAGLPDRRVEKEERVMKSDFMLLRGYAGEDSWIGVREVFEIDGEPAEGERGHLRALLMDVQTPVSMRLRALADQQAGYNLGSLYRTINVPTVALQFLRPDRQSRVRYKRSGTAIFHDARVWTVTFDDRERPTLIRTPSGRDVRSTGVFWIDPRDGTVLRTELHAGENRGRGFRSIILVSYRRHDRFGMLLPDDMNEQYTAGATRIEGHASYGNFRRFETAVRIK